MKDQSFGAVIPNGGRVNASVTRWSHRRAIVSGVSFAAMLGFGLLLWTSSRGSGASQAKAGDGRARIAPVPTPPSSPVAAIEQEGTPEGADGTPTVTSRWEAERAMLLHKTATLTRGSDRQRGASVALAAHDWQSAPDRGAHRKWDARLSSTTSARPMHEVRDIRDVPTPSPVDAPGPGTISPTLVRKVVQSHVSDIQACFRRAAMEHSDLQGRLLITATVDAGGHVLSLSPTGDIQDGARLRACVTSAFQSWTFPAPEGGGEAEISYAFAFER